MNVTDHSVTEAVDLTVIFVSPVPLQQQTDDDDDQYEDGYGHHHNDEPGRLEDLVLYTVGGWKETTETGQCYTTQSRSNHLFVKETLVTCMYHPVVTHLMDTTFH